MKTNKEILREYLDLAIQADLTRDVIQEVADKGRPTLCYDAKLERLNNELDNYQKSYHWIKSIIMDIEEIK